MLTLVCLALPVTCHKLEKVFTKKLDNLLNFKGNPQNSLRFHKLRTIHAPSLKQPKNGQQSRLQRGKVQDLLRVRRALGAASDVHGAPQGPIRRGRAGLSGAGLYQRRVPRLSLSAGDDDADCRAFQGGGGRVSPVAGEQTEADVRGSVGCSCGEVRQEVGGTVRMMRRLCRGDHF